MPDLVPKITPTPGPGWATFPERPPSGDKIEIPGNPPPFLKKRKSGGGRDSSGREEAAGHKFKRPRHSTSGIGLNKRSSISGPAGASASGSGLGSGASGSAAKLSTAPSSPTIGRSSDPTLSGPSAPGQSFFKAALKPSRLNLPNAGLPSISSRGRAKESSTAGAIAALFSNRVPDPSLERWREKKGTEAIKDKGKGKAKASVYPVFSGDSSDGGLSSSTGATGATGVGSTSKAMTGPSRSTPTSVSGSRRASLPENSLLKNAQDKADHGPLYVNNRRQIARKTAGSSKPAKIHHSDRPILSSSGAESGSVNSHSGSSQSPSDAEVTSAKRGFIAHRTPRRPRPYLCARKSMGRVAPQRSIKGKEKARPFARPNQPPSDEVIVIESSEDDFPAKSVSSIIPPNPARKSSGPASLSAAVLNPINKPKDDSRRQTTMDITTAINMAYEKQAAAKSKALASSSKPIEQDIIDLTIQDSDDDMDLRKQIYMKETSPVAQVKQEKASAAQNPQTQPSPPPITPPIIPSPPPITSQIIPSTSSIAPLIISPTPVAYPKTAVDLAAGPPKLETTPRPRSVPMAFTPQTSAPRQSQSARTSPSASAEKVIPSRRPTLPSWRTIVMSSDGSEQVAEATVEDVATEAQLNLRTDASISSIPASSNVSSTRASPELVPPLRRSARHSSASSQSEIPFTDAESPPASSPSPEPADIFDTTSYGGFKALTWESHRRDLANFPFKHYSANDMPTSLPDSINRLSKYTRMDAGIRDVFQAFILENICEDEAGAPEIEIINKVDAEPSPMFEFHYSNRMWYGKDVPMPDYSKLKGCDCVGGCDPKSTTCSCAIRQRKYLELDGCVYEKNGRLKHPRYPIFECNDLCSCGDECRNRVVQHGRKVQISIKKTAEKGWGVFNGPRRIPRGTFLGIYAGELLTDEQGEDRGRYYNRIGKSYLFDIDFWHLKVGEDPDKWQNTYTVDAYHAGNFTRFLNHSCDPNARLFPCYINEADIEKPLLVIFSIRDVAPYEEICFNYMSSYSDDEEDEDSSDDEDAKDGKDEKDGDGKERRKDPVYIPCRCGARKCKGVMWN